MPGTGTQRVIQRRNDMKGVMRKWSNDSNDLTKNWNEGVKNEMKFMSERHKIKIASIRNKKGKT